MAGDVHIMYWSTIITVSICLCVHSVLSAKSLYTDEDPILLLSPRNYHDEIYGTEHALMAEFYSSWCGHCIRFAPTFKQLAREVHGKATPYLVCVVHDWQSVMAVAAIDCAVDENMPVCREFNIEGYPTVKFFPARALPGDLGSEYHGSREVWALKATMLDKIEQQSASNRPPSWPKLHVLQTLEDIWQSDEQTGKTHIVIFEKPASYLGRQVILDLLDKKDLTIRRMYKDSISQFGIRDFPSAYLIDQGGTFQKLAFNRMSNVKEFETELLASLGEITHKIQQLEGGQDRPFDKSTAKTDMDKHEGTKLYVNPDGVHSQDLESALVYALQHEVAGFKWINTNGLYALKTFVLVLSKYFPGQEPVVRYLKKLNAWLQDQYDPIKGEDWLEKMNDLQTSLAYLPSTVRYTGCQGSEPKYRGYPCTVWTLFHTLTVSAAQDWTEDFDPREVLNAMKAYIQQFFGCRECNDNFQKMAVTIDKEVHDADDAILWLWRAHNKANRRLKGDLSEDPEQAKVQFPVSGMCPECWTTIGGTVTFHTQNVLKFLKMFYGSDNIIQDSLPYSYTKQHSKLGPDTELEDRAHPKDVRIKGQVKETENGILHESEAVHSSASPSWRFTSIDISICVVFYVVCTAIIFLGYFHLSSNRRRSIFDLCRRNYTA